MNDRAKQKLVQLLDEETTGVLDEPERLEGLLRDYCGDCRKEISALIAALQEDVPADLTRGGSEPYPILTARLAGKLHEERNIVQDAAQWAVEAWAFALEVAPGSKRHGEGSGTAAGPGAGGFIPGGGTFPGPAGGGAAGPGGGGGAGDWKMPPLPDLNLQKTPLPDVQGGWQQAPPGPPFSPGPGKNSDPPWQQQAEPWKTPGVTPQPWVPANAASLPAHNSFLVCVICFAVTLLMIYTIPTFGLSGFAGLQQVVLVIAAMAGGIELLLAMVRLMLKRPQPPAFVLSSMSFWMTLFSAEDLALRLFPKKRKPQPQMAPRANYPSPGQPPVAQTFVQPPAQTPIQQQTPVPQQTPIPMQTAIPSQTPVSVQAGGDGVFCISCGKTNTKGASSCAYCGEKLYYPEAQQGAAPN